MTPTLDQLFTIPELRGHLLRRALVWTLFVAMLIAMGNYFSDREAHDTALARARIASS